MQRHIRTLTILLTVALMGTLMQSGLVARSASDDLALLYVDVPNPVVLPPGELERGRPLTFMLALEKGADLVAVRSAAIALGAQPLYETRLGYTGLAVSGTMEQISALRSLKGVQGVQLIPAKQRLRTRAATARPATMRASSTALSASATSVTGTGVRIGIIDSGIDYTHATFGGPGTEAAFDANDPTVIESGSFPTAKVIGGFDLAGDTYDADGAFGSVAPAPDADPLDCRIPATAGTLNRGGHGTHVAATAAGLGVQSGATYPGPYPVDSTTVLDLAPGVAPQASLVAFKIFGCRGSTALLGQAIGLAIDPNGDGDTSDRLVDVLNISIGSPFGGDDDPDSQAVNAAVEAGVVVVVAVGDSGNTFYISSSPGSATGAVTVGASDETGIASFSSRGPQRGNLASKPDLVAPGVAIQSAASGSGASSVTMDGTSSAAAQVAGAAALVVEKFPSWGPAQIKAALINTATPLADSTGARYPTSLAGAGQLNISALCSLQAVAYVDGAPSPGGLTFSGATLTDSAALERTISIYNNSDVTRVVQLSELIALSQPGVTLSLPSGPIEIDPGVTTIPVGVSIDPNLLDESRDPFTPARQGLLDRYWMSEQSGAIEISGADYARVRASHLAARPGLSIYIDDRRMGSELAATQTSDYLIAAPGQHTIRILPRDAALGSVAPIVEREVTLVAGQDYTFAAVGGGTLLLLSTIETRRINPPDALLQLINAQRGRSVDIRLNGAVVAHNVSFLGTVGPLSISPGSHELTFTDSSTGELVARESISPRAGHTILAGAAGGSYACLRSSCSPSQLGFSATAWSVPLPPITLHVPYQLFPKSASAAQATTQELLLAPGQAALSVGLSNAGARDQSTSVRGAQTPLVAAFELADSSPAIAGLEGSTRAADLRYVGVTSNYPITGNVGDSALYFATASHAPWSTPNEVQFRVYLDTTGPLGVPDGVDDFVLINTSFGVVSGSQPNDTLVSLLYAIQPDGSLVWTGRPAARYNSVPSPSLSPAVDAAPYNSSVMFQLVLSSFLGLSDTQPLVRYHIETRSRNVGNYTQVVDRLPATGSFEYQVNAAAVTPINSVVGSPNLQRRPLFVDVTGGAVDAQVNSAVLATRRQQGLLLLHLHNLPDAQAEVVTVVSGDPAP